MGISTSLIPLSLFPKKPGLPKILVTHSWYLDCFYGKNIHAMSYWTIMVIKSMLNSPIIRLQREHGLCGAYQPCELGLKVTYHFLPQLPHLQTGDDDNNFAE